MSMTLEASTAVGPCFGEATRLARVGHRNVRASSSNAMIVVSMVTSGRSEEFDHRMSPRLISTINVVQAYGDFEQKTI